MKNVLIINQSSELYGADKALLELLENYPQGYHPIVVLEHEGPLKEILLAMGIQVIKCPVIKLNRASFTFRGLSKVCADFFKGLRILRRETKRLPIDVVHSNAISVLVGAFYCFFFRKKHLWHVHEIVESPKFIAKLYPHLISFFADQIIFNSVASYRQFLKIKPSIAEKSEVVYNGQTRNLPLSGKTEIDKIRKNLFRTTPEKTVVGLVGRISRWKGQYLLTDVFSRIHQDFPDTHLVFVGSAPPGQDHFLHALEDKIQSLSLADSVTIVDFQKNIWPVYDALDICVVPSIEPEPFGLVATEAMLSHKAVVAADHGGLSEIVVDGATGFLVAPRNEEALFGRLSELIQNSELRRDMGEKGYRRVRNVFSTSNYVLGVQSAYGRTLVC